MGERFNAVISEDAPRKISTVAPNYGIRADVDATLSPSMTAGTGGGMTCWEHETTDGKAYSAFIFEVTNASAELYLWRDTDGKYVSIQKNPTSALHTDGVNHLSITCTQQQSGSGPQATLAMSVNGQEVLRAVYGTGGASSPWKVGDGAGIIASGRGSDLFYDNFALRPAA
jgi:hypothetical protein